MSITIEQLRKYPNRVFVETGTSRGQGVQDALDAGFSECRSVELFKESYEFSVDRFKDDSRVKLYFGLSEELLPVMLADLDEPMTFWLDGHYAGEGTAFGPQEFPILQELAVIAKHPVKTHTILIDDMRLIAANVGGFTRNDVEQAVKAINPAYRITYVPGIETGADFDILAARTP